jgi:hypothetical protein
MGDVMQATVIEMLSPGTSISVSASDALSRLQTASGHLRLRTYFRQHPGGSRL